MTCNQTASWQQRSAPVAHVNELGDLGGKRQTKIGKTQVCCCNFWGSISAMSLLTFIIPNSGQQQSPSS